MSMVGKAVAAGTSVAPNWPQLRRSNCRKLFGGTRISGLGVRIAVSSLLGYFVLRSVVG
jgi:hypothetical protein